MLMTYLASLTYPGTQGSIKSCVACWITIADTPFCFSASIKRAIDMPEYLYLSRRNPSLMYDFINSWYSGNSVIGAILFRESTTSSGNIYCNGHHGAVFLQEFFRVFRKHNGIPLMVLYGIQEFFSEIVPNLIAT
ncbi:hypothetical protein SAMN05421882_100965 [Nitrosomonas communis]|uniref:Uncharacterized protein n=1 Tax=Nitrosomonas communis TaxID=44574 RepID=A0A1H2T4M6_9PROT|nr:hypothetical protein SAMN05421882_100965 [Nitrosomonas communis]